MLSRGFYNGYYGYGRYGYGGYYGGYGYPYLSVPIINSDYRINGLLKEYAELNDLILLLRNDDGYTEIKKPSDSDVVKEFLNDEEFDFDLGYLFTENLLDE